MSLKQIELSLRKCVAPEFVFGVGARNMAAKYVKNLGSKHVLIVTDPGVIATGWVEDVTKGLIAEGISYTLFDAIVPNPKDTSVEEGARVYVQNRCDGIVSIGGGSPMDCAKAIGIVVANGGSILAYEGVDKIRFPLPPLIFIPTTAGTSADVSQFAIINDTSRKVKIAIISKAIVPDVALIDPEVTLSMDKDLSVFTGLDALTHAFEAYVSNANSGMTDLYALEAIELLVENLPKVVSDLGNIQARAQVMMASLLAGLAFSNASLGVVHAMAHPLGGLLDLPHGLCNAILLDRAVAFNFPFAPERYKTIMERIAITCKPQTTASCSDTLVKSLIDFKASLGLTKRLGALGVEEKVLPALASFAYKDPCLVTNPIFPEIAQIEDLYASAL